MRIDDNDKRGDGRRVVDELRQTPVFKHLGAAELTTLSLTAQRRYYAREDYIEAPESEEDVVCVVAGGTVRVLRLTEGDREYELRYRVKGEAFVLCGADWTRPHQTVAQAARNGTALLVWNLTAVLDMVASHPNAARAAILLLLERLREQEYMLGELALCTVRTRLIHLLVQHAAEVGGKLVVPDTHRELAAQIGCRREAVTLELRRLRARGLIETIPYRHGLVLLDRDALQASEETDLA